MPNTEVKLIFAENTRLATARKHRSSPTLHAPLAQMVEQLTLNQWALGSNPRWRTTIGPLVKRLRLRPLTPATRVRFSYGSPRPSLKCDVLKLSFYFEDLELANVLAIVFNQYSIWDWSASDEILNEYFIDKSSDIQ